MKEKSTILKFIRNIFITIILGLIIIEVIKIAPNYIIEQTDKVSLIINYNNVTKNLKSDIYLDDEKNIYISLNDIKNFFDGTIYYDEKYDQILTTSKDNIAILPINSKKIIVNGENENISVGIQKKDKEYYLPISQLEDVYNIEVQFIEKTNVVTIESLDRECKQATTQKNKLKYLPTQLSRTLKKVEDDEIVTLIPEKNENDTYKKVMTDDGIIGYIKKDNLLNEKITRKKVEEKKRDEKISLVWEYFSEYGKAPDMTGEKLKGVNVVAPTFFEIEKSGKGNLKENVGVSGQSYIKWAKNNNYEVWAVVGNNSLQDTTSEILNDYKNREQLINNILKVAKQYNLDGINLDFENIKEQDKDVYSRLVIELAPRLRKMNKVLSIDVTAPDGSANWSLCYDRNTLGKVADYLVFMAYDQYGVSSSKPGTTAGFDWVENSLKKFIQREEVDSEKMILAVPFYTRAWRQEEGKSKSGVVSIKNIDTFIPQEAEKVWDEELKQYYSKFEKDGKTYEMWIEDEKSLKAKLSLVEEYNVAGAAYWRRGMETEEIWDLVSDMIK